MTYAANGNILTKSDISATTVFTFGVTAGPYALTKVTSSTGVIPAISQTTAYTSFEKINTLSEGSYAATFAYNSDNQRAKMMVTQNGSTIQTRWYASSSYMKQTEGSVTKEYTWIGGDAYSAPCLVVTQGGATTWYYLFRDHLGSITHVTDASGNVLNEYSFDAWGRRRNFTNWSYSVASQTDILPDRRFTGHEYLKYFNLYNMNGRMYDPLVGRFLNVDPYVQMPDYSQNLNRYSYCLNNPLIYTDPDGELAFLVIAAYFVVNAAIDYGMQVAMNYVQGYKGKDAWVNKVDFFDVAVSGGIGVLTGGAGTAYKAGEKVGKVGMFVLKHPELVKLGEIAVTSGIDITGEGWQPVEFDDFGKRVFVGAGTYLGTKALGEVFSKKTPKVEQELNDAIEKARNNWTVNHEGDLDTYLSKKDWTLSEIQETLTVGKVIEHNAPNYINPGNRLVRIENVRLSKSLIFDINANQVIQLGKPGYLW